jgi:hypothetical protein
MLKKSFFYLLMLYPSFCILYPNNKLTFLNALPLSSLFQHLTRKRVLEAFYSNEAIDSDDLLQFVTNIMSNWEALIELIDFLVSNDEQKNLSYLTRDRLIYLLDIEIRVNTRTDSQPPPYFAFRKATPKEIEDQIEFLKNTIWCSYHLSDRPTPPQDRRMKLQYLYRLLNNGFLKSTQIEPSLPSLAAKLFPILKPLLNFLMNTSLVPQEDFSTNLSFERQKEILTSYAEALHQADNNLSSALTSLLEKCFPQP